MIEVKSIVKTFDTIAAVDHVSMEIREGAVFGLIGTNGAGKSTFLRMLAGILKPDEGEITIDDIPVYENLAAKSKLFFISDEQFFGQNAAPEDMLRYYRHSYPAFDVSRFREYLKAFDLDANRKISTFSKGMKKQLSVLLGICSGTKYLLCDETFDGLDPVMRQAVKSLFAGEMADREFTPVIASHNLRELEDICDHVGLLHKGGVLLSRDLFEMKTQIHKVQCVLRPETDQSILTQMFDIVRREDRGALVTLILRGEEAQIMAQINSLTPVFAEALPLSLEEIFINETGAVGYDIKKLIL